MLPNSFIITIVFVLPSFCTEVSDIKNRSSLSVGFSTNDQNNQSKKITLPSEGGLQMTETPSAKLPNNTYDLYSINEEQGKVKTGSSKGRKEAVLSDSKEIEPPDAPLKKDLSIIDKSIDSNSEKNRTLDILPLNSSVNKTTTNTGDKASSTEHIKKPLILSYEALSNTKETNLKKETSSFNPKTSSKPVEYDQLPSPQGSIHVGTKNQKPEMIIPIVITILVLPALAFLGYMGLKKGREAWKNRHYKRMDFLLDGMYND